MTGPEHFQEAEKLLDYAAARDAEDRGDATDMSLLAEADVHATLALAAATALMHDDDSTMPEDYTAWREVAGAPAYHGPEAITR